MVLWKSVRIVDSISRTPSGGCAWGQLIQKQYHYPDGRQEVETMLQPWSEAARAGLSAEILVATAAKSSVSTPRVDDSRTSAPGAVRQRREFLPDTVDDFTVKKICEGAVGADHVHAPFRAEFDAGALFHASEVRLETLRRILLRCPPQTVYVEELPGFPRLPA